MLYVEEQELAKFKTMVKETKSRLIAERKQLEQEVKNFRELKKSADEGEAKRIDMLIDERKNLIDRLKLQQLDYNFPITQILPVRYGDNIYNYVMLKEIQKKLKGFLLDISIDSCGTIIIGFTKPGSYTHGSYKINPLGYVGAFTLRTPVATLES